MASIDSSFLLELHFSNFTNVSFSFAVLSRIHVWEFISVGVFS